MNKDGHDAKELWSGSASTFLDCVNKCLATPNCKFVVKSGSKCFLKASTPTTGPCAPNDECAVVLSKKLGVFFPVIGETILLR